MLITWICSPDTGTSCLGMCTISTVDTFATTINIRELGLELAMNGYNTSTDFIGTQYSCGASDWWSSPWLSFKCLTTTLSRIATSPFSR